MWSATVFLPGLPLRHREDGEISPRPALSLQAAEFPRARPALSRIGSPVGQGGENKHRDDQRRRRVCLAPARKIGQASPQTPVPVNVDA